MEECVEPSPKRTKRKPLKKVEQKSKLQFPKTKSERCIKCKQFLDSVLLYNGHPNNSNEEFIALTNEKLSLYTGKEETFEKTSELPTHKVSFSNLMYFQIAFQVTIHSFQLTYFSIYDDKGHLCPFDTGLVENNVPLYISGYIKHICEEDPSPCNGIPVHDCGPINEWFVFFLLFRSNSTNSSYI